MGLQVDANALIRFASSLKGRVAQTAGGRAEFRVEVTPDGLEYYPTSSGKRRFQEKEVLERILRHYAKTASMKPSDYQEITWNASYALGLLKRYLLHRST